MYNDRAKHRGYSGKMFQTIVANNHTEALLNVSYYAVYSFCHLIAYIVYVTII